MKKCFFSDFFKGRLLSEFQGSIGREKIKVTLGEGGFRNSTAFQSNRSAILFSSLWGVLGTEQVILTLFKYV